MRRVCWFVLTVMLFTFTLAGCGDTKPGGSGGDLKPPPAGEGDKPLKPRLPGPGDKKTGGKPTP